ncbi:MAG: hypothetical protein QW478_11160 [Candidatus Micrarchaeaceae archaeon]
MTSDEKKEYADEVVPRLRYRFFEDIPLTASRRKTWYSFEINDGGEYLCSSKKEALNAGAELAKKSDTLSVYKYELREPMSALELDTALAYKHEINDERLPYKEEYKKKYDYIEPELVEEVWGKESHKLHA